MLHGSPWAFTTAGRQVGRETGASGCGPNGRQQGRTLLCNEEGVRKRVVVESASKARHMPHAWQLEEKESSQWMQHSGGYRGEGRAGGIGYHGAGGAGGRLAYVTGTAAECIPEARERRVQQPLKTKDCATAKDCANGVDYSCIALQPALHHHSRHPNDITTLSQLITWGCPVAGAAARQTASPDSGADHVLRSNPADQVAEGGMHGTAEREYRIAWACAGLLAQ